MDKKLKNYIEEITKASKHPSAELIEYHKAMTAQFQHERLIHLIVTLFFALFLMIFFGFFLLMCIGQSNNAGADLIIACLGIVTLILLIVTIFYVRHYYQLENGTQKLEDITKKLYGRD